MKAEFMRMKNNSNPILKCNECTKLIEVGSSYYESIKANPIKRFCECCYTKSERGD